MILHRTPLVILLVLGIIGFASTQLLDMTFIVGMVQLELGAETITDERRLELVNGLVRGNSVQRQVNYVALSTTFATTLVAAYALFQTFGTPKAWNREK